MSSGYKKWKLYLQNHKLTKTYKNYAKTFKGLHICTCVHKLTLTHICVLLHNQCPTLMIPGGKRVK